MKNEILDHFKEMLLFFAKGMIKLLALSLFVVSMILVPWRLQSNIGQIKKILSPPQKNFKGKLLYLELHLTPTIKSVELLALIAKFTQSSFTNALTDIALIASAFLYLATVYVTPWRIRYNVKAAQTLVLSAYN